MRTGRMLFTVGNSISEFFISHGRQHYVQV